MKKSVIHERDLTLEVGLHTEPCFWPLTPPRLPGVEGFLPVGYGLIRKMTGRWAHLDKAMFAWAQY